MRTTSNRRVLAAITAGATLALPGAALAGPPADNFPYRRRAELGGRQELFDELGERRLHADPRPERRRLRRHEIRPAEHDGPSGVAREVSAPGKTTSRSAASARPTSPQLIAQRAATVNVPSSGFDWGSAGIGAAAGVAAFAIALAGMAVVRRRRVARPPSVATH